MFGIQSITNKFNIIKIFIIIFLVFFDQITKLFIENNFSLFESFYINNFFSITFVVNYGFAFGFLNNPNSNQVIISILILFIILYISYLMLVNNNKIISLSFTVIIAGAIGNLFDRISRGYVVDFLDFNISNYHWPAFNLADSYISIGFIAIMISILLGKKI
jgi:signal peptidase II